MDGCIFCKIVKGEAECHKIWEDDNHLAFLSIFPNTKGFSVVIPKKHYSSYAFDLPDDALSELVIASKKVAKLIDSKLEDVARTGLIFEGYGVDHVHAKLFPMHGTKMEGWKPIKSNVNKFFDKYEGYISSHDWKRAEDGELAKLAKAIKGSPNDEIMKRLKFHPKHIPGILSGKKRVTWRFFDDKDLKEGDILRLIDASTLKEFAKAKIVSLRVTSLGKLKEKELQDYTHLQNLQQACEHYSKVYGKRVNEKSELKIVELMPL